MFGVFLQVLGIHVNACESLCVSVCICLCAFYIFLRVTTCLCICMFNSDSELSNKVSEVKNPVKNVDLVTVPVFDFLLSLIVSFP